MKLTVTGKQLDVGDAFRTHIAERLQSTLAKYFGDALEVAVTVTREGARYRANVQAHVGRNIELFAEGWAHEPYPAFDDAAEHLAKRLRRHKRRLRDHNKPAQADAVAAERAPAFVLQPDEQEGTHDGADAPPVVAELSAVIHTMTVGQAVMRLDLSREPALLFRSSVHGGLNMVYRRSDGTIGWVDPRDTRGGRG
jgi:ribosomal subunit interface protein